MFCENCGNQLPDDSKFCVNCGAKIEAADAAIEESAVAADVAEAEAGAAASEPVYVPDPQPAPAFEPQIGQAQASPGPRPVQPAPQMAQPAPQMAQPAPRPQDKPPVMRPDMPNSVMKPEKTNPLPVWKFIGMFILQGIPIIGFIMILVWAFGGSFNKNTRNYARAVFILFLIGLVLTIAGVIAFWSTFKDLLDVMKEFGGSIEFDLG
jgi:hypothetical protein